MSERAHGQPSAAPPVSSSPAPRGISRRVVDDEPRRQDKTYRRYASGIERALASFDTGRLEWPDYISFLGRLLKAIQGHPPAVEELPHKSSVANRLAQCLTPSLPSGVHQKAIEKDTLAQDLPVYLPGLTSVLSFASLSLRPNFLSLIETHILSLNALALRPALKALLLGLLPGLEDETSEEFDRTLRIIDGLKDAVNIDSNSNKTEDQTAGDQHFWQCFFLATISNSARRQGSLAYMNKRLPRLKAMRDASSTKNNRSKSELPAEELTPNAEAVVYPEPGLLIRCFAAGLSDDQVLLQRGFLDLLLTHLPLDSPVLTSKVDASSLDLLMTAAIGVVIRRDMSLNRRLWAWLLGPESAHVDDDGSQSPSPEAKLKNTPNGATTPNEAFFGRYGSASLTRSLLNLFQTAPSKPLDRVKPFRICLSLMDRSELGATVISSVFLVAMENLYTHKLNAPGDEFEEVMRSANSFFDGIEAGVIWGQLVSIFRSALGPGPLNYERRLKNVNLAQFIVSHFNIREEEMISIHIPLVSVLVYTLVSSGDWLKLSGSIEQSARLEETALAVLERLVQLIPEPTDEDMVANKKNDKTYSFNAEQSKRIVQDIERFYQEYGGNAQFSTPPLSSFMTAAILKRESASFLISGLHSRLSAASIDQRARLLAFVTAKQHDCRDIDIGALLSAVKDSNPPSEEKIPSAPRVSFQTLSSLVQVLLRSITVTPDDHETLSGDVASFASVLVWNLLEYCSPSFPKHHVESVRCLWQLDDAMLGERVVESSMAHYLVRGQTRQKSMDALEPARRFAVVWTHTSQLDVTQSRKLSNSWPKYGHLATSSDSAQSLGLRDYQSRLHRPLLLLLDALSDISSEVHYFLASWLQALPTVRPVVAVILSRLSATRVIKSSGVRENALSAEMVSQLHHQDDSRESLYYLQHLSTLLRLFTDEMWATLTEEGEVYLGSTEPDQENTTLMESIAQLCLQIVHVTSNPVAGAEQSLNESMQRMSLKILQQLLYSPNGLSLQSISVENPLIESLRSLLIVKQQGPSQQIALLETITAALRLKHSHALPRTPFRSHVRVPSIDVTKSSPRVPSIDTNEHKSFEQNSQAAPPTQLMKCVLEGIASPASVLTLESWIEFLVEILPLYENNIFQNLIPLVECFCNQIRHVFQQLNAMFKSPSAGANIAPEPALMSLLNGLEYVLAAAHERLLAADEVKTAAPKSPEPSNQGFFGNVVSGVFSSDTQRTRGATANTRLTVILCFQDAIRICRTIWTWSNPGLDPSEQDLASTASFAYVSVRLRNKTRRILDRLFSSEPLESLETLVVTWSHRGTASSALPSPAVQLLHVLDGSKPKVVMPTLFNAIYSRTNSTALDPNRTSTLTSDLTDVTLAQFLVEYTQSLEDDAMDEIWADCMTFLKDVLGNPLPHHQILPQLLIFLVTLTEKVDKTNFGEQRKMRKELGDLFLRLLTATFTAKSSSGTLQEMTNSATEPESDSIRPATRFSRGSDLLDCLTVVVPRLSGVLNDNDRLMSTISNISANVISPVIHAKIFPDNLTSIYLALLYEISRISVAAKTWKRDITDAFNNPKLISAKFRLLKDELLPLIRQWAQSDKDRVTELCSRIPAPTSGGMFGAGASATRLEADKRAQINLRRIALVILATENDFIVPHLNALEDKLVELLGATTATSPSSASRSELFMVWQALILKTSSLHLAALWPVLDAELRKALYSSLRQSNDYDTYNTPSLFQACKLLDVLVLIAPDEFQMHEWLFITDTVEAVYRPAQWEPVGLVDEIAEELGSTTVAETPLLGTSFGDAVGHKTSAYKQPLLRVDGDVTKMSKEEFINKALRPFFAQLSIHAYEATYSMRDPDLRACEQALLIYLFDDSTLVG